MLRTSLLIALLIGTAASGSAVAQTPTGTWIIDGKAKAQQTGIRIISARKATKRESAFYRGGQP